MGEPWASAPIAVEVAEGPESWATIRETRDRIKAESALDGIDPDTLEFRLIPPPRIQGKIISVGVCPIYGTPIPMPYELTATIQENET